MNERIFKLAGQAADYANTYSDDGADVWFEIYNKKFAQLIVRECAGIGSNIVLEQTEDNDMGVFLGIKKHFGVEE